MTAQGSKYPCPVCIEDLITPIYQCFNGHLVCKKCIEKVDKCPICRDELPKEKKIRALEVENIIRESMLPCPFHVVGCGELLANGKAVQEHLLNCSYAEVNYCSWIGISCNKNVTKKGLLEHFICDHDGGTGTSYISNCKLGEVLEISDDHVTPFGESSGHGKRKNLAFIQLAGQIFILKCMTNEITKAISWKVCVLGSEIVSREYEASIKIIPAAASPNTRPSAISWKGSILPVKSPHKTISPDMQDLFSVPYKNYPSLFSFKAKGEKLEWKISLKIRRVSKESEACDQAQAEDVPRHPGIWCDVCSDGIVGPRYKCIQCPDYDLCDKCMMNEMHAHHLFVKIPHPVMRDQLTEALSIATALGMDFSETHSYRVRCNGNCMVNRDNRITGIRFKCIECPDFDLCECCIRDKIHSHHLFVIVPHSDMRSHGSPLQCQLKF